MKLATPRNGICLSPGPVAQTFFVDEDISARTKLDAIITVVDAKHLALEIDRAPEAQEQIAFADIVVLNKIDTVSEYDLKMVEARIRRINPTCRIERAERCNVPLNNLLGQDAFALDRILEGDAGFLAKDYDAHDHEHDHSHDQFFVSFEIFNFPKSVGTTIDGCPAIIKCEIICISGFD